MSDGGAPEARYLPYAEGLTGFLGERPTELLVLGRTAWDVFDDVTSTRWIAETDAVIPDGLYVFESVDARLFMLVGLGNQTQDPMAASTADLDEGGHPLEAAWHWRDHLWPEAQLAAPARFGVDDNVIVAPDETDGRILHRSWQAGTWLYSVRTEGRTITVAESRLNLPEFDGDPVRWVTRAPATLEDLTATLTTKKLNSQLTDMVFSFRTTRTTFRPYQFKPVLKMIGSGASRMLIADEVGLGKTIEAGLLWTELEARRRADRVLVVCPSGLVAKWQREMEDRFGFQLTILDRPLLDKIVDDLRKGRPQARSAWICSLERLRSWEGMEEALELGLTFDLILVDEAHAMRNQSSKSYRLGETLDVLSEVIVFLSATPLNLGDHDLLNLLHLLQPGEFPTLEVLQQQLLPNHFLQRIAQSLTSDSVDPAQRRSWLAQAQATTFGRSLASRREFQALSHVLSLEHLTPAEVALGKRQIAALHSLSSVLTRTRKVDVQEEKPVRQPLTIEVDLTQDERTFVDLFQGWCAERAAAVDQPTKFVMQMPLRLVSSCIPAAAAHLRDRAPIKDLDTNGLPDEVEPAEAVVPPSPELTAIARRLGDTDSKYDAMIGQLKQLITDGHQVLIFTFSRATIAYLIRRLDADGFRATELHGGIRPRDRHEVIGQFRSGSHDVLVANRVASEGLDFEFCSAVINYDLPWNPMEVEQRIGRIDRIGQQQKKILAGYFHVPGTIETDIIARVMERIHIFERSIGELEPIVAHELKLVQDAVWDFRLTVEQRRDRAIEAAVAAVERQLAREDVSEASDVMLSGDYGDIEGLEEDLRSSGRYVGAAELGSLVAGWIRATGARCRVSGTQLSFWGNASLADDVQRLASSGVRTPAEVAELAAMLRQEQEVTVSLDWDALVTSGVPLLTPTHPLVVAALARPSHRQAKYGEVRIRGNARVPGGEYLALLTEAQWHGQRPMKEIWATVVDTRTSGPRVEVTGGRPR